MAHAYCVAVSKLETFLGDSVRVVMHNSLPDDAKTKALRSISTGHVTLDQILLHPTQAPKLFHRGSDLLADWDLFHLKEVLGHDDESPREETLTNAKKRRSYVSEPISEIKDPIPSASKKKSKSSTSSVSIDVDALTTQYKVDLKTAIAEATIEIKGIKEKAANVEMNLFNTIHKLESEAVASAHEVRALKENVEVSDFID